MGPKAGRKRGGGGGASFLCTGFGRHGKRGEGGWGGGEEGGGEKDVQLFLYNHALAPKGANIESEKAGARPHVREASRRLERLNGKHFQGAFNNATGRTPS